MRVSVEIITPRKAQNILDKSQEMTNRKVNKGLVSRIARDILTDRWEVNGEAIILDGQGLLLDGQHRLLAVIEADREVQSVVSRGASADNFATLDSGNSRTPADVLGICGWDQEAWTASAVRWVNRHETGTMMTRGLAALSNREAADIAAQHPELVKSVEFIKQTGHRSLLTPVGSLVFLHWLFTQQDKSDANIFMYKLLTGENLSKKGADGFIYLVREKLLEIRQYHASRSQKGHKHRMNLLQKMAMVVKGWNRWRDGDTKPSAQKLGWKYRGKKELREAFPTAR